MDLPLHPASASPGSAGELRRESPFADAVIAAITAPRPSLDDIRGAVVGYARAARELAIAADDMLAGIAPRVRRAVEALPTAQRAELLASVSWWALHGYYGAD